jgi:hypothetical protein
VHLKGYACGVLVLSLLGAIAIAAAFWLIVKYLSAC